MGSGLKPNWLLRTLVVFSIGVHALIFARVAEFYSPQALSYIELTLQDNTNPSPRIIPRPRCRPKKPPSPVDLKKVKCIKRIPDLPKPIRMDPIKTACSNSGECIGGPGALVQNEFGLVHWDPNMAPFVEYETAASYLEMVKLRIEREKRYPENARTRQIEGHITVQFVITPEGNIKRAAIVKKSGHAVLNEAALLAVNKAAPFQKPPPRFFKGDVTLTVTIVFELT